MKTEVLYVIFCIAVSFPAFTQNFQDGLRELESVEELDNICKSATLGFMNTPGDIEDAVNGILKTVGIKNISDAPFVLKDCPQINNAVAKILKDENGNDLRYVLYDPNLLQNIVNQTNDSWSAKFVLAHEIGHHMLGHSLNNGSSNHKYELDADYWAGRALSLMGASEEETISATRILPERASASHPARSERLEKATEGWNSVERTRVIKVRDEDINEIAKAMVSDVDQNLMEKYSRMTVEDFGKNLQALDHARTTYYKAYTEDIRYLEAICLTGMKEKERAEAAYINYLSIDNLYDNTRIKHIVLLFVDANTTKSAFFRNPDVLFQITNEYYSRNNYEKAIIFGNQFLEFAKPEEDKERIYEVNKLIGMSEYKRIMNDKPDPPDNFCKSASLDFINTPRDIEDAVNDILKTVGIKNISEAAFALKNCTQINHAAAKTLKDENGYDVRYVLYDPNLFQNIINKTNNSWSAKFVLAHEIGHHMLGHSLDNGSSNHKYELDADYWAGRALSLMGASEEGTISATLILPERASASHPARSERLKKAMEGWSSVKRTNVSENIIPIKSWKN